MYTYMPDFKTPCRHHRAMATLLSPSRAPPRPRLPLILYIISIILCLILFYFAFLHCRMGKCGEEVGRIENIRLYPLYVPVIAAPLIAFLSLGWMITSIFYNNSPCILAYNYMEMPCAVFCSLLSGISAVIVIHYSYDYTKQTWSEHWSLAALNAIILGAIHAVLAFALQ